MMSQAWQPLLANVALIAVVVSFWTSFRSLLEGINPRWTRIIFGVTCGGTSIAVMAMPFEVEAGIYFDLRAVPVVLAGFFSGLSGGLAAALMAGAWRLWSGGGGTVPGLVGVGACAAIAIYLHHRRGGNQIAIDDVLDLAFGAAGGSLLSYIFFSHSIHHSIFMHAALPCISMIFLSVMLAGTALVVDDRQQRIARTNEIYSAVMDALPDCLNAKDSEGRFLVANPATARLMGASDKSALIGRTDADFYDGETAAEFRKAELSVMQRGLPETMEQQFLQNGGQPAWLSTLKVPFAGRASDDISLITHNRDITAHKLLELSLTEAQERLSDALTHMADGLVMFDGGGRLVLSSARFLRMFSIPEDAMLTGTPLRGILEEAAARFRVVLPEGMTNAEWVEAELEKVRRLEPVDMHMTDGRWIHVRHAAVDNGGWLSVFSDITERKRSEQALIELNARLSVLAQTDGLTGLTNRKTFDDRLYAEFARSQRHGATLGLLLADVDRFKAYNDVYGHPEGDSCLIAVAGCLKDCAKRPNDVVARYGGEEFVAVFPETDQAGMQAIADNYLQAVRDLRRVHVGSEKGVVTVSVGVAVMIADSDVRGPADLVRAADAALYRAKGAGRDCVRFADVPSSSERDRGNQRAS